MNIPTAIFTVFSMVAAAPCGAAQAVAGGRARQLIEMVSLSCPCGCQCTADDGPLRIYNQDSWIQPNGPNGQMEPLSLCSWMMTALGAMDGLPPLAWGGAAGNFMECGPDWADPQTGEDFWNSDLDNKILISQTDYNANLAVSSECADAALAGGWLHEVWHALDTVVQNSPVPDPNHEVDRLAGEFNGASVEIAFLDMLVRYNDCLGGTAFTGADMDAIRARRAQLVVFANQQADSLNQLDEDLESIIYGRVLHVQ